MSAPLPIGVVGVGALGRHHARHLAQLPEACLIGVFDTDAGRARTVADELGTTAFPDLDGLLDQVQAVTVAVPTKAHHEVGANAARDQRFTSTGRKRWSHIAHRGCWSKESGRPAS